MTTRNALLATLLVGLVSTTTWATPSGELVGWGYDGFGLAEVPAGNDFVAIAGGVLHSLALKSDGSLAGWGNNGNGDTNIPAGNDFVAIAAGQFHSLALKSNGSLVAWGGNNDGQTNVPAGNNFVAISATVNHSLALRSDGSLAGWGNNSQGQTTVPAGNDFVAIASGYYHGLALKSDGSLAGWGDNVLGQTNVPAGNDFVAIAAGNYHSLALKSDGSLVGWGDNSYGQTTVPDGNDFVAIASGYAHGLALRSDGSLAGWGFNVNGQSTAPTGTGFVAIAAGSSHSLAIRQVPSSLTPFVDNPTSNSVDWSNFVQAAGGGVDSHLDFETHPAGPLQNDFYLASHGVTLSQVEWAEVETGSGGATGSDAEPLSPGEGPLGTATYVTSGAAPYRMVVTFDEPVMGAGFMFADYFNAFGDNTNTIKAFSGPNGTGFALGQFQAVPFNFETNNLYFMGLADMANTIGSVVLSGPRLYGDSVYLDKILFARISDVVLPGDYNHDDSVDAADYVVWRNNLGQPAGTLPNDTDGGVIGTAQYDTWRAHFGETTFTELSASTNAAVPEPTSLMLLAVAASLLAMRREQLLHQGA